MCRSITPTYNSKVALMCVYVYEVCVRLSVCEYLFETCYWTKHSSYDKTKTKRKEKKQKKIIPLES